MTHNHVRVKMDDLQADSDRWLSKMAADPEAVLQALGIALNRIDQGASWLWLIVLGAVLSVSAKIIPRLWRGV